VTKAEHPFIYPAPSLKRRLFCMIYESLLAFGVIFFSGFIFDVTTQSYAAASLRHIREAVLFIVIGSYFTFFWTRSGQTLAMQTWRIQVVNTDNQKIPLLKAIVRYCLAWMLFLPGFAISAQLGLKNAQILIPVVIAFALWVVSALFNKDGQFPHDVMAKTRLIQLPPLTVTKTN
jgi:uncharacterized RDD family membrane protein YckC